MSELQNETANRRNNRWQLLATASAVALVGGSICGMDKAQAADSADPPSVWIELGGQLSRMENGQETFSPALMDVRPSIFSPSGPLEKQPIYSIDATGKLSFQPNGSDWVFSAAVQYGRSRANRHAYQQTHPKTFSKYISASSQVVDIPSGAKFAKTHVQNSEQHSVLDFQAGKDVGLGMFGRVGSSVFNAGVRFAQFSDKSNIALKSNPDWHFDYIYFGTIKFVPRVLGGIFHTNEADLTAARSFHGIGPSLSWNASAPIMGAADRGEIVLDWGVNAAVLFGRQKAVVHHHATGQYLPGGANLTGRALYKQLTYQPGPVNSDRSRSVTVPNLGGFAGATFRIENFKVSAGYRADFFFGAMDGGIDTRKTFDRNFYGPFATISIGLGG